MSDTQTINVATQNILYP